MGVRLLPGWQRIRPGVGLEAVCFLLSGAADLLSAAQQVIDPMDFESFLQFLIGTRHGNMTLLKNLLMLFAWSVLWCSRPLINGWRKRA
jgi:hypothetical protein